MKKKPLVITISGVILILVIIVGVSFYQSSKSGFTSESYQSDADIVRLNDIRIIGKYIDDFHKKLGRYPLEGKSELPNYVHIASSKQRKYVKGGSPNHMM